MISRPRLIVDEAICRSNISRMSEKAIRNGVELRPHFKTHQSHVIGEWYRDFGVTGITVSSFGMAKYFADNGWEDITVAFPCNINEIELINELASQISLRVFISNNQVAEKLASMLKSPVRVYIEIDEGGGRTGFSIHDIKSIEQSVEIIKSSSLMTFHGIYCHVGQNYSKGSREEVIVFAKSVLRNLGALKSDLTKKYGEIKLCYGDTPSCSLLDSFDGVDEISAGNFIFYDTMQVEIGSCSIDNIAVALACPVASVSSHKSEACIYGGAIHLSKDKSDQKMFGLVAKLVKDRWEVLSDVILKKVSQEHGIVELPQDELNKMKVGDILYVLPIHSCLTADCMGQYYLHDGTFIDHYAQKKHAF